MMRDSTVPTSWEIEFYIKPHIVNTAKELTGDETEDLRAEHVFQLVKALSEEGVKEVGRRLDDPLFLSERAASKQGAWRSGARSSSNPPGGVAASPEDAFQAMPMSP